MTGTYKQRYPRDKNRENLLNDMGYNQKKRFFTTSPTHLTMRQALKCVLG